MKILLSIIISGLGLTGAWAQEKSPVSVMLASPTPEASATAMQQVPDFLQKAHSNIKDPMALRDPFKRQNDVLFKDQRARTLVKEKDSYSNYVTELPEDVGLNMLKLVGVLLGPQRRAIVRVNNNNTQSFIVREGMVLGTEKAEVKAILPGGMVLVEKIKNVYNQDEYVETIIPLSRDDDLEKKIQ